MSENKQITYEILDSSDNENNYNYLLIKSDNDLLNKIKNDKKLINNYNFNKITRIKNYDIENNANIDIRRKTYSMLSPKSYENRFIYNKNNGNQTPIMSNNNLMSNEYFQKIKSPDFNRRNIQFENSKNQYILNNNRPYSNRNFKTYEFCNQYNRGNYNDKLNPNIIRNNEQKDEERKQIIELNDENNNLKNSLNKLQNDYNQLNDKCRLLDDLIKENNVLKTVNENNMKLVDEFKKNY